MGDYEAACALPGPWGGPSTAQLCGRVCAGCPLLHSLAVPRFPWDHSKDGICSAITMPLQCCCQGFAHHFLPLLLLQKEDGGRGA